MRRATPALERFARETLGCGCAPEVFSRVEDDATPPPGCPEIRRRIAIGGRLLIYVAQPADAGVALERMPCWVAAGRAERDERAMNRLRLVVALDGLTPEILDLLQTRLRRLPELIGSGTDGADPRIHLHCVPCGALAAI